MSLSSANRSLIPLNEQDLNAMFRPQFLTGDQVNEAFCEAHEVVFLQQLQTLTSQDLMAETPEQADQIKALLTIVAHDLFMKKQTWTINEARFTLDILQHDAQEMAQHIHRNLANARKTIAETAAKSHSDELIADIVAGAVRLIAKKVCNYLIMRNRLYGNTISFDVVDFYKDIQQFGTLFNLEHTIEEIHATITEKLCIFAFARDSECLLNIMRIDEFDCGRISETIHEVQSLSVRELCDDYGFNDTDLVPQLQVLVDEYLTFHESNKQMLQRTARRINMINISVDEDTVSSIYKFAFGHLLERQKYHFIKAVVSQMYLESMRKPDLREHVLYNLQIAYMPLLMTANDKFGEHQDVGLESLIEEIDKTIYLDAGLQPSLHNILHDSYLNLIHSAQDSHDQKPLFAANIPGTLINADVLRQNKMNYHYTTYFRHYMSVSHLYANTPHHKDREIAVERFSDDFRQADSVDNIATLMEVSKAAINRHKHPVMDRFFGKSTTHTWSKLMKVARDTALNKLDDMTVFPDIDAEITHLNYWRNHSLFAEHRSNFKVAGAFGRTDAQKQIDMMIDQRIRTKR